VKTLSFLASLFCLFSGLPAQAQTPPASRAFTADLARYYFASPSAEIAARSNLDSALQQLEKFKAPINSGAQLYNTLQAYESVLKLFRLHDGYLHLRCSQNRHDPACDAREKLEADVDAATAFLNPEILAIPEARLQSFFSAEPRLNAARFALADIRHDAEHVLPEDKQALLDRFQPEIADWQYSLYEQLLDGIPFGSVQTPEGPLSVVRQRTLLAANPDPKVREEAFKRRFHGLAGQRDLLAFSLIHTVKAQNSLARAHKYPDAPTRKYANMYLDPSLTRALLDRMAQRGDVAKRFEKIRGRDFQAAYKLPMQAWDLSAPQPGFAPPLTPLESAPALYHQAFASLGAEYQQAFDALLDPANGRADLLPGGAPDRYSGGFSIGFSGAPSILFFGRYDGTFKDLSVIAHEGGHAAHRSLMSMNGVSPLYANGPHFLFESFAIFNELVLADYLAAHSQDPRLRRYYREQWMAIKGLDAFYGAKDALLEQRIYEGVAAGSLRGADDLDKLTLQVDGEFSIFPSTTPELRNRWATVSLMYEDPLYDVNYVYGGLLALKYYQLYTSDPAQFVPRYTALLKNGFDAPPAELLKHFLDIELLSPSLLADDLNLLNRRLAELEADSPNSENPAPPATDAPHPPQ
jgi:oligoendopeptidase F